MANNMKAVIIPNIIFFILTIFAEKKSSRYKDQNNQKKRIIHFRRRITLFTHLKMSMIVGPGNRPGSLLLHYTGKDYKIHTFSSVFRFLYLSFLKNVGVNPVTFLNWLDRWATLL